MGRSTHTSNGRTVKSRLLFLSGVRAVNEKKETRRQPVNTKNRRSPEIADEATSNVEREKKTDLPG